MKYFRKIFLSTLLMFILPQGCGGGSQGTGTHSIDIEGRLVNADTKAIPNASVTILQTGSQTHTDSEGGFKFSEERLEEGAVQALFETIDESFETSLGDVDGSSPVLKTEVVAPVKSSTGSNSSARNLSLKIRITSFPDETIFAIRGGDVYQLRDFQSPNQVLYAFFGFKYMNSSSSLEDKKIKVEVQKCGSQRWRLFKEKSLTGDEDSPGRWKAFGDIQFKTFPANSNDCLYRVSGPYDVEGVNPHALDVIIYTYQARHKD